MARTQGIFNFSANLEVKKNAPLDARVVVANKSDLYLDATWQDSDGKAWLYDGIVVTVTSTHEMYMLTGYDPVSAATVYKTETNWKRVDAGGATQVEVIDSLESDSSTGALSAKQGKELNSKITSLESWKSEAEESIGQLEQDFEDLEDTLSESINNKLSAVYRYKSSCTYAELADFEDEAEIGDVYNVTDAHDNVPAGTNYAWTGEGWDALAGSVDLSNYVQKGELNSVKEGLEASINQNKSDIAENAKKIAENAGKIEENAGKIQSLSDAFDTFFGDEGEDGPSFSEALENLESTITEKIEKKLKDDYTSQETFDSTIGEINSTLEDLEPRVEANETAIEKLLSTTDTTEGSVLKIVKEAGYIKSDALVSINNSINTINASINSIEGNITTMQSDVSTLKSTVESQGNRLTVVENLLQWGSIPTNE